VIKIPAIHVLTKLTGRRQRLVKDRRNAMVKKDPTRAADLLKEIHWVDAQIALLQLAPNTAKLSFDLDAKEFLEELGFGVDEKGNHPAL
jgi:hypothetical protein